MKPQLLLAAAGIPPEIGDEFVVAFTKRVTPILCWLPLDQAKCYTDSYSQELYVRLAAKLRKRSHSNDLHILSNTNLVLLYVQKDDDSESMLFERFGTEELVAPLTSLGLVNEALVTGNQRGRLVNQLAREGQRAIIRARALLSVIAEEVTNRDNRTCLLLPRRNFGRDTSKVFGCVRDASLARYGSEAFRKNLKHVSQLLRKARQGKRDYFVGQDGLIFRSPGKAGARHGLAPIWGAAGHEPYCVIRGRMRFGASYDPKFHYDCDIPRGRTRSFPNCHDTIETVPRDRNHVNIAPNDNIR